MRGSRGFTYLAVLFAVAIMGAAMAVTGMVWKTVSTRAKEAELLWVGEQYRRAIVQYASQGSGLGGRYPQRLEDLLEDRRVPVLRRHLRRLYPDPLTGRVDWVLLEAPEGGIVGVHSRSLGKPLKTGNFPAGYEEFKGKESYADWKFAMVGPPPDESKESKEARKAAEQSDKGKPGAPVAPRSAAAAGIASQAPTALPESSVTLQAPGAPALAPTPAVPEAAPESPTEAPAPESEPPAQEGSGER